jgi:kynurenine 3-monooxygenase
MCRLVDARRVGERHITLIGAGLAGSLLAIYLARRGHRVTVYEWRPDLRRVEIPAGRSINLALANRGIAALAALGLMDDVEKLLIPMRGRMLHDEDERLELQAYGQRPHEVIHSVSRLLLTALLLDAAEATGRVRIRFGMRCEAIDLPRGTLTCDGSGGREDIPFEVVIGCDGVDSSVRRAILEATSGACSEEPLAHGYKELSIPPAAGGGFRMEPHALHIWPRGDYMLIALPNLDGGFTVTLFLPHEGRDSFATLTDEVRLIAFFETRFPDASALMPHLAAEFFRHPTGRLGTLRVRPWRVRDRALILGDAAHAIVPFHGQGMNCAFEDCSALDACLRRWPDDWAQAFAEFETLRKPNTEAIADLSIENYLEMRSTVRDPKYQWKKALAFRLEDRHPERFIPRYSMVMFHRIPYAEAKRRGIIQDQILEVLTAGVHDLEDVDYAYADQLIHERLDEISER